MGLYDLHLIHDTDLFNSCHSGMIFKSEELFVRPFMVDIGYLHKYNRLYLQLMVYDLELMLINSLNLVKKSPHIDHALKMTKNQESCIK